MLHEQKNFSVKVDQFTLIFKLNSESYESLEEFSEYIKSEVEEIEKALKIDIFEKVRSEKSIAGYDTVYEYGGVGIRVAYHSKLPAQGIIVYFTGAGWLRYGNQVGLNLGQILSECKELRKHQFWCESYHLSRLDFALDLYDRRAKIDTLANSLKRGTYASYDARNVPNKRKIKTITENSEIKTMYIGSRESEFFVRCYDKKIEQLESKEPLYFDFAKSVDCWYRYEAEIKYKLARKLTKKLETFSTEDEVNNFLAQVVFSRLKFRSVKTGKLHFVTEVFSEIANGAEYKSVIRQVRRNQALEHSKKWYFNENSGFLGTLYKIKEIEGDEAVDAYLRSFKNYLNEQYKPTKSVEKWLENNK